MMRSTCLHLMALGGGLDFFSDRNARSALLIRNRKKDALLQPLQFIPMTNHQIGIACKFLATQTILTAPGILQMARSKIVHDTQVLPSRLARRVKVRNFTNADSSVSTARSKALVITCRGVEDTTVVPNG